MRSRLLSGNCGEEKERQVTWSTASDPKSPKQKDASQRALPTPSEDSGSVNWMARSLPQTSEVEILGTSNEHQQGFDDLPDEEVFDAFQADSEALAGPSRLSKSTIAASDPSTPGLPTYLDSNQTLASVFGPTTTDLLEILLCWAGKLVTSLSRPLKLNLALTNTIMALGSRPLATKQKGCTGIVLNVTVTPIREDEQSLVLKCKAVILDLDSSSKEGPEPKKVAGGNKDNGGANIGEDSNSA
ncbi:hypothetical protein B0H14DRAFT_2582683 [Mycena olivaceomarginata]|nr:hypothetical protein B0H14DRAFT_2582683 [Mycena olivaceomarginata]